ncbi:hypothetical protein [Sutterella sp.]|uniref:hypothetical protein n=1 Tax=Sutterella sp. TaxID=1981025 RepID=UPI003FD761CC
MTRGWTPGGSVSTLLAANAQAKVAGTYDGYEEQVQKAFIPYGHKVVSFHHFRNPSRP